MAGNTEKWIVSFEEEDYVSWGFVPRGGCLVARYHTIYRGLWLGRNGCK
jgi:hypothetical protein